MWMEAILELYKTLKEGEHRMPFWGYTHHRHTLGDTKPEPEDQPDTLPQLSPRGAHLNRGPKGSLVGLGSGIFSTCT